jgi:hypothetical protein
VQAQGWRAGFFVPAAVAALGVFVFASGDGSKTEGRRLDGIGALGVLRATHVLCYFNGLFDKRNSLLISSFCRQLENSLIERVEIIFVRQAC